MRKITIALLPQPEFSIKEYRARTRADPLRSTVIFLARGPAAARRHCPRVYILIIIHPRPRYLLQFRGSILYQARIDLPTAGYRSSACVIYSRFEVRRSDLVCVPRMGRRRGEGENREGGREGGKGTDGGPTPRRGVDISSRAREARLYGSRKCDKPPAWYRRRLRARAPREKIHVCDARIHRVPGESRTRRFLFPSLSFICGSRRLCRPIR